MRNKICLLSESCPGRPAPSGSRYTRWKASLLACLCLLGSAVSAQSFVQKTLPFREEVGVASQWADFDGDGDLDVLFTRTWRGTTCYRNDGPVFTRVDIWSGHNFQPDFGDFNQDGRLDVLSNSGIINDGLPSQAANIFPFDGCGYRFRTADLFPNTFGLEQAVAGTWGDHDGDGDTDVLFGIASVPFQLILFQNQDGLYRRQVTLELPTYHNVYNGLTWEDYDRDGDPDILLLNNFRVTIFRNQNGAYTQLDDPALNRFPVTSAQWTDLDGDGNLDLVQSGYPADGTSGSSDHPAGIEALVYRDGQYQPWFTDYGPREKYTSYLYCRSGDWDNDGRPDLVVSVRLGNTDEGFLRLYRNTGAGFAVARDIPLPAACVGLSPAVVDYDRDGDLDIACGRIVFENTGLAPNLPPAVPAVLPAAVSGNGVTLSWQPATDDHAAPAALTYNVHLSTSVEGLYYLNGMSRLATGQRNVLKPGNAGARTSKRLTGLPDGTYYWTVQAVDPGYAASPYAPSGSFTISNGQATTAAIALAQPQLLNSCECAQMVIGVRPTGTFGPGNRFLIQLSDSTGSFARPTLLYNMLDNYTRDSPINHDGLSEAGTANGWIPQTVKEGTRYRVRVVSTNPVRVSPDNGYDVAIKKLPQLAGIAGGPQELCQNPPDTRLQLSVLSQYANSYEWELLPQEAGVLTANGAEASIDWNITFIGKATVRVNGVNGCGRGPVSADAEFTIRPPLGTTGPLEYPDRICGGQRGVTFQIPAVPNVHTYRWQLSPGLSLAAGSRPDSNLIQVDVAAGFTQGSVGVQAWAACGESAEIIVQLSAMGAVPQAGPVAGPATVCRGAVVTYSVPPAPHATQYQWTLPAGFVPVDGKTVTATGAITLRIAETAGSGVILLNGANECGEGPPSLPYPVTVWDKPAVTPLVQGPKQVCPGGTAVFRVEGEGPVTYEWRLPEGMYLVHLTDQTRQLTARLDARFAGGQIEAVAVNECGKSEAVSRLRVDPYPALPPPAITRNCNVLEINGGGFPVQWFLDGQPLAAEVTGRLVARSEGSYSVSVYAPCDTAEAVVYVKPFGADAPQLPNVITPNGDGYNDTFQIPADWTGAHLEIYNRWGKAVYRDAAYRNDWAGEPVTAGMYYYVLKVNCLPRPLKGVIQVLP